jgi:hypothetical protein
MDGATREIVGLRLGNCSLAGALGLWQSLPVVYCQCAACYTNIWEALIMHSKRPRAVGKNSGLA